MSEMLQKFLTMWSKRGGVNDSVSLKSESEDDDRLTPNSQCAICLGKIQERCFTGECLHQFCYTCLKKWSEVKAECPLCKKPFHSIIYNVRSISDYDEYPVPLHVRLANCLSGSELIMDGFRNESVRVQEPPPFWTFPEYYGRARYRHDTVQDRPVVTSRVRLETVYNHDRWALPLPDFNNHYRPCHPSYFRANPRSLLRVEPFLRRELAAIYPRRLLGSLKVKIMFVLKEDVPMMALRRILSGLSGRCMLHFLHELFSFMRSPFDMHGYDLGVRYGTREEAILALNSNYPSYWPYALNDELEVIGSSPWTSITLPSSPSDDSIVISDDNDTVIVLSDTEQNDVVLSDSDSDHSGVVLLECRAPPPIPVISLSDLEETPTPASRSVTYDSQPSTSGMATRSSRLMHHSGTETRSHSVSDDSDDDTWSPPLTAYPLTSLKRRRRSNSINSKSSEDKPLVQRKRRHSNSSSTSSEESSRRHRRHRHKHRRHSDSHHSRRRKKLKRKRSRRHRSTSSSRSDSQSRA